MRRELTSKLGTVSLATLLLAVPSWYGKSAAIGGGGGGAPPPVAGGNASSCRRMVSPSSVPMRENPFFSMIIVQ